MQEAVATLADMLQKTLVITEYLDGQVNPPRASDVEVEVLEERGSSLAESEGEEEKVGELESDSEYEYDSPPRHTNRTEGDRLLGPDSSSPRGAPSWRGSPCLHPPQARDRNSPSPHFLDLDRAFQAPRTQSYSPAPDGYVHIDDTTITSAWSDDADADDEEEGEEGKVYDEDEPADVSISIESIPSPVLSPTRSPCSVRRFPYDRYGSLPTIPEVDEEDSPIRWRWWARRGRETSLSSSVYSN